MQIYIALLLVSIIRVSSTSSDPLSNPETLTEISLPELPEVLTEQDNPSELYINKSYTATEDVQEELSSDGKTQNTDPHEPDVLSIFKELLDDNLSLNHIGVSIEDIDIDKKVDSLHMTIHSKKSDPQKYQESAGDEIEDCAEELCGFCMYICLPPSKLALKVVIDKTINTSQTLRRIIKCGLKAIRRIYREKKEQRKGNKRKHGYESDKEDSFSESSSLSMFSSTEKESESVETQKENDESEKSVKAKNKSVKRKKEVKSD